MFLKENPLIFLYIPLYIVLSFGLVVVCIWQYISFGTISEPFLEDGALYYSSRQSYVLQVFNAIEFIWGIQFLRDSGTLLPSQAITLFQGTQWSGTSTTAPTQSFNARDP